MKQRILFLLIAILGYVFTMLAQSSVPYHPFVKEGKVWNCCLMEHVNDGTQSWQQTTIYSLELSGDTVVNCCTYKKMYNVPSLVISKYAAGIKDTVIVSGVRKLHYLLWREQGHKVFVFDTGIRQEYVIYDFSSVEGSTIDISYLPTTILSVDSLNVDGQIFRRFHVDPCIEDGNDRVWIEGVGHPEGPFRVWGVEVNDGRQYQLLACYEDGECIFTAADFYKPGVNTGIESMYNEQDAKNNGMQECTRNNVMYDLQGRRILGSPKHGVYIQNGKKVMK